MSSKKQKIKADTQEVSYEDVIKDATDVLNNVKEEMANNEIGSTMSREDVIASTIEIVDRIYGTDEDHARPADYIDTINMMTYDQLLAFNVSLLDILTKKTQPAEPEMSNGNSPHAL